MHLLDSYNIKIDIYIAKLLRNMSILIYLLHGITIRILEVTLNLDQGFWLFFLTLIASVALSSLIIHLSDRFKILAKLY